MSTDVFNRDLVEAMNLLGWRPPETDGECATLLVNLDKIAKKMAQSKRVKLDSIRKRLAHAQVIDPKTPIQFPTTRTEIFRQAARSDDRSKHLDLPYDILQRMERDRLQAESEKEEGDPK
jgi:hypothetical protein